MINNTWDCTYKFSRRLHTCYVVFQAYCKNLLGWFFTASNSNLIQPHLLQKQQNKTEIKFAADKMGKILMHGLLECINQNPSLRKEIHRSPSPPGRQNEDMGVASNTDQNQPFESGGDTTKINNFYQTPPWVPPCAYQSC